MPVRRQICFLFVGANDTLCTFLFFEYHLIYIIILCFIIVPYILWVVPSCESDQRSDWQMVLDVYRSWSAPKIKTSKKCCEACPPVDSSPTEGYSYAAMGLRSRQYKNKIESQCNFLNSFLSFVSQCWCVGQIAFGHTVFLFTVLSHFCLPQW